MAVQHTPSTHWLLEHSWGIPHGLPLVFLGWQMPAAQKLVAVHFVSSPMQSPLHWVAPHTKLPQLKVWIAGQAPAPLHPAISVATLLAALQLSARHCLVLSGYAQLAATVPLHVPPQPVASLAHWARTAPWGLPLIGMHVPTLAGTSHASHCPVHAALQHTPSAQWLLPH